MNTKDDQLTIRKFQDKANQAYNNYYPTYTDFLDIHEQNLLIQSQRILPNVSWALFGGYDDSDRKIAAFYPEEYADMLAYPIKVLRIEPLKSSLSSELSHRDYLGAILNLGVQRHKIGDIICSDEAIVFCLDIIAPYIIENLISVRNTSVLVSNLDNFSEFNFQPNYQIIKGTVSSLRIDSIVKLGFSLSRGRALALIEGEKVYINSRICSKASSKVEEGDVISVRGMGKMKLTAIGNTTKKERIYIELSKYK